MFRKYKTDACANCNIEPPQMKFKCPECEHNPEKLIVDKIKIQNIEDLISTGQRITITPKALEEFIHALRDKNQELEQLNQQNFNFEELIKLQEDKISQLEIRLNELTSPIDVKDCPHRCFNGETVGCKYYEGQNCEDPDFVNCMFRENKRLTQFNNKLKSVIKNIEDYCTEQNLKYDYTSCKILQYIDILKENYAI